MEEYMQKQIMKWPEWLMLLRHTVSKYNFLKEEKKRDPLYQRFLAAYDHDFQSPQTVLLAREVAAKYRLGTGDYNTPVAQNCLHQAVETGRRLSEEFETPDVILVSPYDRTQETLDAIIQGWPVLKKVKRVEEERIREQNHGLATLYNDWRVFFALHPEQKAYYDQEGEYWYCWPQGEDVPKMRDRNRLVTEMIIREYSGKRVMMVTHHLNILAIRANHERWGAKEFLRVNEEEKPKNCGVTLYRGNPEKGKQGKLELEFYNKTYY